MKMQKFKSFKVFDVTDSLISHRTIPIVAHVSVLTINHGYAIWYYSIGRAT